MKKQSEQITVRPDAERVFQNLRLLVTAFGLGTFLMGTVALWGIIPTPYKVMFLVAQAFTLYSCLRFATTTHSKYANNK